MTRNRASAKKAGSAFERLIADYLAEVLDDDRIDRRVKRGQDDRGDIGGVRSHGQRLVLECKDAGGQIKAGEWMREAHDEMANDSAVAAVVVAKRRGTTDPGSQWVMCTVRDFIGLITGQRPEEVD